MVNQEHICRFWSSYISHEFYFDKADSLEPSNLKNALWKEQRRIIPSFLFFFYASSECWVRLDWLKRDTSLTKLTPSSSVIAGSIGEWCSEADKTSPSFRLEILPSKWNFMETWNMSAQNVNSHPVCQLCSGWPTYLLVLF